MKSILYVGATLMISASIYGFVDYRKTSRSKEFKKMYDSKEETSPVVTTEKTNTVVIKPETVSKEKMVVIKKQPVETKEVVEKNSGKKETVAPVEKIEPETTAVNTSLKNNGAAETDKPVKTKKVLSYKLFSRAPLEEKYINKELKSEPKKTENKEQ
ncbi:MAG: hypothetical protein ACHQEB_01275 [Chitinophagales bacterium]